MLVDTHCHLNTSEFASDADSVIDQSVQDGVCAMIIPSTSLSDLEKGIALSESHPACFALAGFHPEDLELFTDDSVTTLKEYITTHKNIVGVGEVGLDYHWHTYTKEQQKKAFSAQASLARDLDIPVIIHAREAERDALTIIQELDVTKAVFHCYTGPIDIAREIWDSGYFMSFTACIGYPKSAPLREIVAECPLKQLMLETDAPYMAPQHKRGKRCTPSDVASVCETVAEVKKMSETDIAEQTTKNAFAFFTLPESLLK